MNELETKEFREALTASSPVALSSDQLDKMTAFCRLLLEKNKSMNLTAVKGAEAAAILHFADSLHVCRFCKPSDRVLDVGSGGGFPAFPVAVCSSAEVTALDATAKKLDFISEAARQCGVTNLNVLCGRAEELSRKSEFREAYDTVLARGVSRLNVLCEWCLPFVKVGGVFVAMKGSKGEDELNEAKNAVKTLGGTPEGFEKYNLYGENRDYSLVIIRKTSPTPELYPRHNSKIERKPL